MIRRALAALRPYQPACIDAMCRIARGGAFMRPGLGKTVCQLMALDRMGTLPALVVAPAQVVESEVWSLEADAWEDTCHLRVVELTGTPEQRRLKLILGADVLVVSYELLREVTDFFRTRNLVLNDHFRAIVYDELSKMKHPGTRRFKRMRVWARETEVRMGLTGSPLGNHWMDIYGEMLITAGTAPFGSNFDDFKAMYFNLVRFRADGSKIRFPVYEVKRDGSVDAMKGLIKPHCFSLPKAVSDRELPQVAFEPSHLKMPPSCRAKERELMEQLEVELDSGTTLFALSNSKLGQLIRQFASGAVYTNEARTTWEEVHDVKLRFAQDTVDELQGAPVLIFAWFRHSKERLLRQFPKFEVLRGTAEQVRRWNAGLIPGLIANPQGSGMGLNLQHVCSEVLWFDPEWSREKLDQGNGRLARLGQKDPWVSCRLPLIGDIDRRIWTRLQEKGEDEAGLIEAVALDMPDFY